MKKHPTPLLKNVSQMPSGKMFDCKCNYLAMNFFTISRFLSLRENSDDLHVRAAQRVSCSFNIVSARACVTMLPS